MPDITKHDPVVGSEPKINGKLISQRTLQQTPPAVKRLREIKGKALAGGPPEKIAAQREKGKLTARERITYLTDDNSFREIGLLRETRCTDFGIKDMHIKGDGVITGFATIDGRRVAIFSEDFTQLGGSLGRTHAQKIACLMRLARKARTPIIGILDSGGARIQEGVDSLDGYGEIFSENVKCSGIIPQISIVLGPCAGGAVYSPALTDFIFMVKGISRMFVTGPGVLKTATGQNIDFETLGGTAAHSSVSGVCHFEANSEQDCFRQVRELLNYLPSSRWENPSKVSTNDPENRPVQMMERICNVDSRKPYRMHHVIWWLADDNKFLEVHHSFAKNCVIGFIRLGGSSIGVVANNPAEKSGALDINSSDKIARFIRFCNNFNIPLLTLVDVPGFLPGMEQEHGGIIRHGAKILYAYCEATVPKVTLILRKAYGGAYIAMNSKMMNSDLNFALPSAEIAVMGPSGAINTLYSKQIREAKPEERDALCAKLTKEYSDKFASPYQTASTGSIDSIIEPSQSRQFLIEAFKMLEGKRVPGEHPVSGNIPL
ncbi:MAG: acyl-CoA carboxylase subunit beta [Elusimicrobiales bacterium]|nr:acyl-CoA carboxylase subunit beta [Elusimicrobiales bacterium]